VDEPQKPIGGDTLSLEWSADLFSVRNQNDITFATSGPLLSQGYFANIGPTRRLGVDLSLKARWRKFEANASYGFVLQTFESRFLFPRPFNPATSPSGFIPVRPGDRLPNIPLNSAKLDVR
jgi:outer membrane receptor protein involved in Fe transport